MLKKLLLAGLISTSTLSVTSSSAVASSRPQVGYIMSDDTQYVDFPFGCGYGLNDWKDNLFARGEYGKPTNWTESSDYIFFMYIDGRPRYLETIYKTEGLLLAKDSTYEVSVETPSWDFDGWETSTAKATLRVTNMRTGTSTNLIVQAWEGC